MQEVRLSSTNKLRCCPTCGQDVRNISLGVREFAFWDGISPRGISISNIDGVYHDQHGDRHWGRILVAETKRLNEPLYRGQALMLDGLSWIPDFTVVLIYETLTRDSFELQRVVRGDWQHKKLVSGKELALFLKSWWAAVVDTGVHPLPRSEFIGVGLKAT